MDQTVPTLEQVARRLIVLKFLIAHAITSLPRDMLCALEQNWSAKEKENFSFEADEKNREFWERMRGLGLWDELTPRELRFAKSTIVNMTAKNQIDFSWRMEAAQVLMWALQMLKELPPLNYLADHDLLKKIPSTKVTNFINNAVLHPHHEIETARETAELWHWRSRTRQLIENGRQPPVVDPAMKHFGLRTYDDIVRKTASNAYSAGTIASLVDGDFGVSGKAYRDLNDEEWSQVRSVTQERHFALNWLCGYAPNNQWDETPTDT